MPANAPDRRPEEEARRAVLQNSRGEALVPFQPSRCFSVDRARSPKPPISAAINWTGTGRVLSCPRCSAEIGRVGRILRSFRLSSHLCPM
jgi:hypothetical protein